MMEKRPPLTSPDGSSNRNSPERCPRPLYSRDSTQEHQEIPQDDQNASLRVKVKEETEESCVRGDDLCKEGKTPEISTDPGEIWEDIKAEEEEKEGLERIKEEEIPPEISTETYRRHEDLYGDFMMVSQPTLKLPDGFSNRNPPERRPHPLYSRDSTQEHQEIPQEDQSEVLRVKVEVKDEIYTMGDDPCKEEEIPPEISTDFRDTRRDIKAEEEEEGGHVRIKEEEIPTVFSTNGQNRNYNIVVISTFGKTEDEDITSNSSEENPITQRLHPTPHGADLSPGSFTHGECFPDHCDPVTYHTEGEIFSSSQSGKCFNEKAHLPSNEGSDTVEEPYSCSECGKCFSRLSILKKHERTHIGEKPFSCPECGKCFTAMSGLKTHKMCSSPDIGQCVPDQDGLTKHHMGEKPFSCRECGKCFSQKSNLIIHERSHTGERPHFCTDCGKCFSTTTNLASHRKTHTGEKPYSCSECGKCFSQKSNLITHERSHTGEKPYSCTDCGKSFSTTANLTSHRKTHTGEKPYSCSECGKCFSWKACLIRHQRVHTG
ncbi:oocyte zinc finger protein XlCOF22-like isoform X3 [Rana temporaria]|uniref:oocyte zinc finger protein XlCOF22-like isoform X3 n=1 Tax=Rana temporaria TaxID=8407 RepID=UPI001AAE0B70|nr:oocyte zinc finger protein XlCOF22-like isoform X3 [Rana temporaria]